MLVFLFVRGRGARTRRRHLCRKQSHSAALLSLRVPTRRNVYQGCTHFVPVSFCTREGTSNKAAVFMPQAISPVQQRRPQPAAETGRSCWGRVLIFQSPAKGLQKNQQTQPVRPCTAGQAISPAGCCLVRGSQRVGMSNNRLRFTVRREDSNKAAARSAASKATARLCLACGCQPVGMSNKRTTVHPGENRTVLKPVKHICVLVFLFSVRREDSSYPFLFFIQMRYSPSVMRVSRYRMGVQHASRMGMGRLPVA